MSSKIERLFEQNRAWAGGKVQEDPNFFTRLASQQAPEYLWIGCSDSRVPANQIVGLDPGEVFVHRNVANMVHAADLNCLAVLQYAVEALKVRHVIVCGHYGCGGVRVAMSQQASGLTDHWLRPIKDMHRLAQDQLSGLTDEHARVDHMCEFNVRQQVRNVARCNILQNAWSKGQDVAVHGWIYSLDDGLIRDLDVTVASAEQLDRFERLVPVGF